jgi:hypothetical protein
MKHKLKIKEKEKKKVWARTWQPVTPFPVPFFAVRARCAMHGRLGWRRRLHNMKDKLKIKEKEKKGLGAHLAARHPVPRSRSSPFVAVVPCTAVWDGVDAYMI